MCLYPKLINNPKYIANKKNKGVIPPLKDDRIKKVPIGCGRCMECKKQEKRKWQIRLQEEIKHDKTGRFMTLTFSEEWLNHWYEEAQYEKVKTDIIKQITLKDGTIRNYYKYEHKKLNHLTEYEKENRAVKMAVRKFLERWRKKHGTSVKHWFITELGHKGTERIHIHGLMFTNEPLEEIQKIWKYGYADDGRKSENGRGYVNEKTINYIIKYVHKTDIQHKSYKPRILTSAGIGKKYIESYNAKLHKYKREKTKTTYTNKQGFKMNLPIYYRNHLFTEEQREQLWINLLDKEEMWINGIKIDVSKTWDNYHIRLKQEQLRNKELGYGERLIPWTIQQYENEKRELKNFKRAQKIWAQKQRELKKV